MLFTTLRKGLSITRDFTDKAPRRAEEPIEESIEEPIEELVEGPIEELEKGKKTGYYANTWANRKKGVVGQKYEKDKDSPEGGKAKPDPVLEVLNDAAASKEETPQEIFDNLFGYGMRDPKDLTTWSGLAYSEVQKQLAIKVRETEAGMHTEAELARVAEAVRRKRLDVYAELAGVSVHDRWATYNKILDATILGFFKSMIAFGSGGVGKTWDMQEAMKRFVVNRDTGEIISKTAFREKFGPEAQYDSSDIRPKPTSKWRELRQFDSTKAFESDDYEYVVLGGSISPVMTYASIYQHNGKICVFDDIDKILKNKDGLDVIKGALDGEIKEISWATSAQPKDLLGKEVPKSFKFTGRAIFITNLTDEQLKTPELQPITQSRAEPVNLTMTKQETIDKLQSLVPHMEIKDSSGTVIPATPADLQIALDYMVEHQHLIHAGYFNARKLAGLTKILVVLNNRDVASFRRDAVSSLNLPSGNQLRIEDKFGVDVSEIGAAID